MYEELYIYILRPSALTATKYVCSSSYSKKPKSSQKPKLSFPLFTLFEALCLPAVPSNLIPQLLHSFLQSVTLALSVLTLYTLYMSHIYLSPFLLVLSYLLSHPTTLHCFCWPFHLSHLRLRPPHLYLG